MRLDRRTCDRARRARDARFDGRFFIGVTSTRVYCRPICPARAPLDANVRYFDSAAAAEAAGFRPCLRCRPEASPGTPAWAGTSGIVSRGLRLIGDGALDAHGVERLADRLGVTARHLRRLFLQHLGATPLQVALTRRRHFAKQLLDETALPFRDVAVASGFGSLRRFNGEMRRTYSRTPTELRRLARQSVDADPGCYRFRLAYRPPYDWRFVLAFLQARASPGVEAADALRYRRTISVGGQHGVIDVSRHESGSALALEVRFPDPRALLIIVERVRAMFDLGADTAVIADHLSADPLLARALTVHPGIRTPGAWDAFELAVRAILGQQIAVRVATTLAGRVAAFFGSPLPAGAVPAIGVVPGSDPDLTPLAGFAASERRQPADLATSGMVVDRLFPTPAQLADANVERAGVIRARADAIRALARRVVDGTLTLDARADAGSTVEALRSIPGIGDWTAQYIAMRALGEPDAFPSSDLILRRTARCATSKELERRSKRWRPWRSYAVMLLWQCANDGRQILARRKVDANRHRGAPAGRVRAACGAG